MAILLSLVLPTMLLGTASAPQFVPGEILAKFVSGTEGSAAVMRAGQVSPPDLEAVGPIARYLREKTGVPLKATQILGGNWLMLAIDGDGLTDQLIRQLRTRENVAGVRVSPAPPEAPPGISTPKPLVITFAPGTMESKAVAQLMRELERDLDLPLRGELRERSEVLVQVDLQAFTLIVVDRIRALCDIESVQPNYILRIQ